MPGVSEAECPDWVGGVPSGQWFTYLFDEDENFFDYVDADVIVYFCVLNFFEQFVEESKVST